jgi:hypothetical protein
MDFTLDELKAPGPGRGPALPPDIDVRRFLQMVMARQAKVAPSRPQITPAVSTMGARAQR